MKLIGKECLVFVNDVTHPSDKEGVVIYLMLSPYALVPWAMKNYEIEKTGLVLHWIETENASSIREACYWVPHSLWSETEQVGNMLRTGAIREYLHLVLTARSVPKKSSNRKLRYHFCVDFQALYQVTKFDFHPLPLQDDVSSLAGRQYFSISDRHFGFW